MALRVLLTRPKEEIERDRETFERFGFEVVSLPTIGFEPLPFETPDLERFDYVYFGSKRGVGFFLKKVKTLPESLKVVAVGEKTSEELRKFGVAPFLVLEGSADHLLELAKEKKLPPGRMLVPTSDRYLKKIHLLEDLGFELTVLPVYRTILLTHPTEEVLRKVELSELLIFTSPSTFKGLILNLQNHKELLCKKIIVAIGRTTREAIEKEGCKVAFTPSRPDTAVLARELAEALNGDKR